MKKLIFLVIGMFYIINFVMAEDLILPPKTDLARYIIGKVGVRHDIYNSLTSEVRIWGWSKTGKIAFSKEYIDPGNGYIGPHIERLFYYILDTVNDKIVFECMWDGDQRYTNIPNQLFFDISESGIERLFNIQREAISNANLIHGITYDQTVFTNFPLQQNNFTYNCHANIVFRNENMDLSGLSPRIVKTINNYDVIVSRNDEKSKIIYSGKLYGGDFTYWPNMHICGYLKSPKENRIVVVVALECAGMGEGIDYEFYGCHLDVGFN